MNIIVKKCPSTQSINLKTFVRNKLSSTLGRARNMVRDVSVYLADINGPKGGQDKTCKIVIHTIFGERIVIKDAKSNWQAAISSAAKRGQNTLFRQLGKLQNSY